MLRLSKFQARSFIRAHPLQLNTTRLVTTAKKLAPTCIALNGHKVNHFSGVWQTATLVTAVGLVYNSATSNVLALETNDRKLN